MSRCVRKVEGENWCIVYCNTSDIVFHHMFESVTVAHRYIKLFEKFPHCIDRILSDVNSLNAVIDNDILNNVEKELDEEEKTLLRRN